MTTLLPLQTTKQSTSAQTMDRGETLNGTKLFNRTDGDMTVSNVTLTNLDYDSALQDGGQNLGVQLTLCYAISDDNLSNIMENLTTAGDDPQIFQMLCHYVNHGCRYCGRD